jgi:hypothetical protein
MKPKKTVRKLELNKKTVSNLSEKQMNAARGAYGDTCPEICRRDVTVPVDCSWGGPTGYTCDYCGTGVSECQSIGQKICTTQLPDTCC